VAEHLLDYAGALDKLVGLQGEVVDLSVRGADGSLPLCLYYRGSLRTGDFIRVKEVGYHRDALALHVDDLVLTLHPNHFVRAVWTEDADARTLRIVMGPLEFSLSAGL
jgi:hypothetical protein